jgi:rubrerythrin
MGTAARPEVAIDRRAFLLTTLLVQGFVTLTSAQRPAPAAVSSATIDALTYARAREMTIHSQYLEFSNQAKVDGYHGIAYLFAAFAAAEFIHARNFNDVLTRLGAERSPLTTPAVPSAGTPGTRAPKTKANLLKAATDEREDVDTFYPAVLKRLQAERIQDAIAFTTYAWESERQHRAMIGRVLQWAPGYFERVAKKIDQESGQYFVCGSTVNQIPKGACPVCRQPSGTYDAIAPPINPAG